MKLHAVPKSWWTVSTVVRQSWLWATAYFDAVQEDTSNSHKMPSEDMYANTRDATEQCKN